MGDDKAGPSLGQTIHRRLDHLFRPRVDTGGGFIEDQNRCLLKSPERSSIIVVVLVTVRFRNQ